MGDYHPSSTSGHTSSSPHRLRQPRFIITGFGEFCGVVHNPTEQLVKWLQKRACHTKASAVHETGSTQQPGYCISSLNVLEVSADAVNDFMQKQQELLLGHAAADSSAEDGPQPVVFLHFGVDTKRPAINLELQAYNNATFSCPDEAGWQPKACLIEPSPGLGTSSVRTTTLPLQELVQQLRDAGFECSVSRDAGRFVCNYTYYKSLQLTSKLQQQLAWQHNQQGQQPAAGEPNSKEELQGHRGAGSSSDQSWPCFSLFVHMPSCDVLDEKRQREFVLRLLDVLAACVAGTVQVAAT